VPDAPGLGIELNEDAIKSSLKNPEKEYFAPTPEWTRSEGGTGCGAARHPAGRAAPAPDAYSRPSTRRGPVGELLPETWSVSVAPVARALDTTAAVSKTPAVVEPQAGPRPGSRPSRSRPRCGGRDGKPLEIGLVALRRESVASATTASRRARRLGQQAPEARPLEADERHLADARLPLQPGEGGEDILDAVGVVRAVVVVKKESLASRAAGRLRC